MRKKMLGGIICCIVLIVLAFVVISAMGHKTDRPGPEQQAQAALTKLLSCTLQQADELDAALSPEVPPDAGPGIQEAGSGLEEYLAVRFGEVMTEDCIRALTANRAFYRSVSFARTSDSEIAADRLEVTKRAEGQFLYDFSAEMKASAKETAVATAFGTITMEETETGWKASKITLTVKALPETKGESPSATSSTVANEKSTLNDLIKAESELNSFLEEHPEITYEYVTRGEELIEIMVIDGSAELMAFVESYPIPQLFFVDKYIPDEMMNPD